MLWALLLESFNGKFDTPHLQQLSHSKEQEN